MSETYWNPTLHLCPPQGWMNDPNGLCQYQGDYHAYYQYAPDYPASELKHWGHAVSHDLLSWEDQGIVLGPDVPADRDGVYSGCAVATDGELRVLYTGNVIDPSRYPLVDSGRESNQILVTSADGQHFGRKRVVLDLGRMPEGLTQHVRDPKVWEQDGLWWMVLGARERGPIATDDPAERGDRGIVLLYRSADLGESWEFAGSVRPVDAAGGPSRLGYMWECPNVVALGEHEFLAVCPQGLPEEELRWQNLWQAGYFALPQGQRITSTSEVCVDGFVEWDHGFDFYAPQVFSDDSGRTILMGWMGTFDRRYTSMPEGMGFCHCQTLPRELAVGADGLLLQWPVRELDARRGSAIALGAGTQVEGLLADVVLEGVSGAGELWLNDSLCVWARDGRMGLRFAEDAAAAAGRTERTIALDALSDLRVVVDGSTVEAYANGGAEVFSTRWFPQEGTLRLRSTFEAQGCVYSLR